MTNEFDDNSKIFEVEQSLLDSNRNFDSIDEFIFVSYRLEVDRPYLKKIEMK